MKKVLRGLMIVLPALAAFSTSLMNIGCEQTVWNWMIYGVLLAAVVADCLLKIPGKKN